MSADRSDVAVGWLAAAAFAFDAKQHLAAAFCLVVCLSWIWPLLPHPWRSK